MNSHQNRLQLNESLKISDPDHNTYIHVYKLKKLKTALVRYSDQQCTGFMLVGAVFEPDICSALIIMQTDRIYFNLITGHEGCWNM
jgi:hypothetical protein